MSRLYEPNPLLTTDNPRVLPEYITRELRRVADVLVRFVAIRRTGPMAVPRLAADPASGTDGDLYYNTASNKFRGLAGGVWVDLH